MSLGMQLVVSYLVTIVTEVPCGYLWKLRSIRDFAILVCINTITNPAVVLLSYILKIRTPLSWTIPEFVVLELIVFIVEAVMYKHLIEDISHPWLYSLQVNLLSIVAGILVSAIII